jgi:hypothetical protein
MKSVKYLGITVLLILSISLSTVSGTPSHNGVSAISHSPSVAEENENLTVSITFVDTANVSSVGMFYCRIEPEFLCYSQPFQLVLSENTYSVTFKVVENSSYVIGYHLFVEYSDETQIDFPDERKLDYGLTISEPSSGAFYYRVEIGQDDSNTPTSNTEDIETSETPFYFSLSIIAIFAISYKRRK